MSEIIVTLENEEKVYSFDSLGVSFESSPEEILTAVQPVILEESGLNIKPDDIFIYTAKKIERTGNVLLFAKSTAAKR